MQVAILFNSSVKRVNLYITPFMKKVLTRGFFLAVIIFNCFQAISQQQKVVIRILQDQSIPINKFETHIKLEKKTFKVQILLDHVQGIYVFASIRDSIYRFTETSPIHDFPYLKLLELKEDDIFNTHRELNISETGWSYWFYSDSAKWHPFNRKIVSFTNQENVCTKMVKQLNDVVNGKTIRLKDINTPLYLFFIAVKEYDENGRPVKELMRRKVRIDWEEDDD